MSSSDNPSKSLKTPSKSSDTPPTAIDTFSPAIHMPPFDIEQRIAELEDSLDPKSQYYEPVQHHVNIKKLIELYKNGSRTSNSTPIYICNGEIITREKFLAGAGWTFVDGLIERTFWQAAYYTWDPVIPGRGITHHLLMEIRLDTTLEGDGTSYRITVTHDTGCTIMVIWDIDRAYLGNWNNYLGNMGSASIVAAGGQVEKFPRFLLQVRLCDIYGVALTDWMREVALARPAGPGIPRLTGSMIRDHLIFATPIGNQHVAVGDNVAGVASLL